MLTQLAQQVMLTEINLLPQESKYNMSTPCSMQTSATKYRTWSQRQPFGLSNEQPTNVRTAGATDIAWLISRRLTVLNVTSYVHPVVWVDLSTSWSSNDNQADKLTTTNQPINQPNCRGCSFKAFQEAISARLPYSHCTLLTNLRSNHETHKLIIHQLTINR